MIVDTPEVMAIAASEEEEARQAIDMLRGEDVSGRVAAANRLEAVAAALGEERTRDVSVGCVETCVCRTNAIVQAWTYCTFEFTGTAPIFNRWSGRRRRSAGGHRFEPG